MNVDELIRDSIDESTAGHVPSPDLGAIRRGGRVRSALRTGGAALATIGVVAAGTVAVQSFGGPSEHLPASIRGQGPVAVADDDGNTLYLGDRTLHARHTGRYDMFLSAATEAGVVYLGAGLTPYLIAPDGSERELGAPARLGDRRLWQASIGGDTNGRYAAWPSIEDGTSVLHLFDAESPEALDRTSVDLDALLGQPTHGAYVSLVRHGVVYVDAYVGAAGRLATVAWDPSLPEGQQVYQVTDPGTHVTALESKTVLKRGPGPVRGPDGEPLDDGWTVLNNRAGALTEMLSVSGQWRITGNPDGELWAVRVGSGERVDLAVPHQALSYLPDGDGSVLVVSGLSTQDPEMENPALQDCDIPSGTCTEIRRLDGAHWPSFPAGDVE